MSDAPDLRDVKQAADGAHRRIDIIDRDVHLLKSQVTDMRVDVKSIERRQGEHGEALTKVASNVEWLRKNREEDKSESKANFALVMSFVLPVIGSVLVAILLGKL